VQARDHYLTKLFEIRTPAGETVFQGYKTNPKLKCKNSVQENYLCDGF